MRYIYIDVAGRYRYLYKFQLSISKFTQNQHDFSFWAVEEVYFSGIIFSLSDRQTAGGWLLSASGGR